eukprot:3452495-Pleurochrysis_carterae.AAC.1
MIRAYRRPPSIEGRKDPARSTWISRPGCEGVRVELASAHEAQDGSAACRRLRGASVVNSVRHFKLEFPQCRRRCMYRAASSAAMAWMFDVAREECMARERPCADLGVRRRTCHSSNSPPRLMNGRSVRLPSVRGGSSRARTLPKWQSVLSLDHSCATDSSESRIDGTHRTLVSV